jgi:hypothetical protein
MEEPKTDFECVLELSMKAIDGGDYKTAIKIAYTGGQLNATREIQQLTDKVLNGKKL